MPMYSVSSEESPGHIPANPERTATGQTNPVSVYYREFASRYEMVIWFKRQSWEQKQVWRPWLSSPQNRQMLAQRSARNLRAAQGPQYEQACLFA